MIMLCLNTTNIYLKERSLSDFMGRHFLKHAEHYIFLYHLMSIFFIFH